MRKPITKNDRFDNLLVIEILDKYYVEPSGKKRRKVLVQCDCGEQFEVVAMYLFRKGQKCSKCRFNTNCIVAIGEVYDQLTVIGFEHNEHNRKVATCQCSCGNIITMRPELLKTINQTNNCGCQHRGMWKGIGNLSQTFICHTKRNARVRGISFEVSIEYLWKLYERQNGKCALSGLPIYFGKKTTDTNDASIDRIDSDGAYTEDNVQWVHKDVQKMKMELPQDRFIELCKLIGSKN